MGAMPKFIAKLSKFGGQYRITLPRGLVDECKWHGVEFIILSRITDDEIKIRRFIDRESLGIERKEHRNGSD